VPATGGVADAIACHALAVERDRCEAEAEDKINAAGALALQWWELPCAPNDGASGVV
jgi:hypothetical protein